MRQALYFILLLLFFCFRVKAQTLSQSSMVHELKGDLPDSSRIRLMLELGRFYLKKPGGARADLDSSLLLARQVEALGRKAHNKFNVDAALLLTGEIDVQKKQYDSAEALMPLLLDPSRMLLWHVIINDHTGARITTDRDRDSALAACHKIIEKGRRMGSLYWEAQGWQDLGICQYLLKHTIEARTAILFGWSLIRKNRSIIDELYYLESSVRWSGNDTGLDSAAYRNMDLALQDAILLLRRSDSLELLRDAIYCMVLIGDNYNNAGRWDLAMYGALKAYELNKALGQCDPIPLSLLSGLEIKKGNLKQALQYALEGVRLTESGPMPPVDGAGYSAAGRVYLALNDLPKSLDYYKKTVAVYYRNPASCPNDNHLRAIVTIYLRMGRPLEALSFLDTAERRLSYRDNSRLFIFSNGRADCYFALHRYDRAEKFYLQSLAETEIQYPSHKFVDYFSLAELYNTTAQYRKSLPYLVALTADSNRVYVPDENRRNAFWLFYQADSAIGDFRQANAELIHYQRLKDSVFNDTLSRQLQELTARYETEKKDQDIVQLGNEAKLRNVELARSHAIRNALLIVAFLLSLLAGLLYNRYRLRQRSNRQLQEMNARQYQLILEKEWLMREIHHRVKNNLQLVISLLNMQATTLKDEMALSAFEEISGRIRAISLIHQKLYREQADITQINMRQYIAELVDFLQDSITADRRIGFRLNIDAIELDVGQCVPVGLILNEAVTNAIKYAFPNDGGRGWSEHPTVDIELKQTWDSSVHLLVEDNGIGLPDDFDPDNSGSMGLQLIRNLSYQLGGLFSFENSPGLRISIVFPSALMAS